MNKITVTLFALLTALLMQGVLADTQPDEVYAKLPVKEVTIFKDGHAYVLHEGTVQSNAQGDVVLDELPTPIMGAFWAYSTSPQYQLQSIVSSRDEVMVEKPATSIVEFLKANVGSDIVYKNTNISQFEEATILGVQMDVENASNARNNFAILKTREGTKLMPIPYMQNITFVNDPKESIAREETKDTMTLKFKEDETTQSKQVGMAYIQKGIRWIPSYRVELDGKGKAKLKLQGTIVNELADLNDVIAHLVVGVPSFAFKDTLDPISFQETAAQLSQHFTPQSRTRNAFSNALMSQSLGLDRYATAGNEQVGNQGNPGPEVTGSMTNEDLFVFSLEHVTLKQGQRMVVPVAEYELNYEDIYTLDINFAPPLEMRRNFNTNQHLQLARLFHAPKAMHQVRLTNDSKYPLTTAPATIFSDGRVLAQGMMKFASIGGTSDLEITTALDIKVENSDEQVGTNPNAVKWNGSTFTKVDMSGVIELNNYSGKAVTVCVTRSVLGNMEEATSDGVVKQLGHGYNGFAFEEGVPFWWSWCNWPWWWYRFNSVGEANWEIQLQPNAETKLDYTWHYYWN